MVNYENDGTQNKHINDVKIRSAYESMIKECKEECKEMLRAKPYYLQGGGKVETKGKRV